MLDGSILKFGAPGRGVPGTLYFLGEIQRGNFQRNGVPACPICIDGDPTGKEHVPQQNHGGHRMTKTCKACSNGLGSRVEADFQDWFDNAHTKIRFEHTGDVPGRRRVPDAYLREADDGTFVMLMDGEVSPEVQQMLQSGEFTAIRSEPDPRRCRLALLKHAYLAACLYLRAVPDTPDARAIRADLVAARNATEAAKLPDSELAKRLRVHRSHVGKQGPPLALVGKYDWDIDTEPEVFISLAGVLFVSWPFSDLPPGAFQRRAS